MTKEQFAAILDLRLSTIVPSQLLEKAADAVHKMQAYRIFDEGNIAGNSKFKYSTKPAYFSKQAFVNKGSFRQQGKNEKGKFKNGHQRSSAYLPQGYAEFRAIQGRQRNFVNLQLSGDLREDFENKLYPTHTGWVSKLSKNSNRKKLEALREKYGSKLFTLTEGERKIFKEMALRAMISYLK